MSKKRDAGTARGKQEKKRNTFLSALVRGMALTGMIAVGLYLLAAKIAYSTPDPTGIIQPVAILLAALTSLTGGICCTIFRRGQGIPMGGSAGIVLAVLFLVLSFALRGSATPSLPLLLLGSLGVVGLSLMGGILATPRKRKKERQRPSFSRR